jgi:hypothetical protein
MSQPVKEVLQRVFVKVQGIEVYAGAGPADPMRHRPCGTHWPREAKTCPGCGVA